MPKRDRGNRKSKAGRKDAVVVGTTGLTDACRSSYDLAMPTLTWMLTSALLGGALVAVAAILLFVWARGRPWRHRRTVCIACGHSRQTLAANARCVECGCDLPAARRHCRSRRRRLILPSVLLFLLGGAIASAEWILPRLPPSLPDRLLVASEPLVERLDAYGKEPLSASWRDEIRERLAAGGPFSRRAAELQETRFSRRAAGSLAARWLRSADRSVTDPLDQLVYVPAAWPPGEPLRVILRPQDRFTGPRVRATSAIVLRTTDGVVLAHHTIWPPLPSGILVNWGRFGLAGRVVDFSVELPSTAMNERSVMLEVAVVELDNPQAWATSPPHGTVLASRRITRDLPEPLPLDQIDDRLDDPGVEPAIDALLRAAIRACLTVYASSNDALGGCLRFLIDFTHLPGSACLGLDASIAWLDAEIPVGPLVPNRVPDDSQCVGTFAVDLSPWIGSPHAPLLASAEEWPTELPRPRLILRGDRRLALRTADRIDVQHPRVWTGTIELPLLRCGDTDSQWLRSIGNCR